KSQETHSHSLCSISIVDSNQYLRDVRPNDAEVGLYTIVFKQPAPATSSVPAKQPAPDPEALSLIAAYSDVVTNDAPTSLPPLKSVTHEIHLIPGSNVPARPPYRLAAHEHEALKKEI